MNITKLEQFLLLAELQNMSKTAEILYISQSALSQSIRSLEKELGCELFLREKKRLILNRNGEFLLPQAREIVEKYNIMRSSLDNFQQAQSTLNIGSSIYALYVLVTAAYNLVAPTVQTTFFRMDTKADCRQLKSGEIDIALTTAPLQDPEVKSMLLFRENTYVLLPAESPLCGASSLTLRDLQGMKIYRNADLLKDNGIFYAQNDTSRLLTERLRANDIHTDYVNLNTIRLLWNSPDHIFLITILGALVMPEIQSLSRRRIAKLTDVAPNVYYITTLRNSSAACQAFSSWFFSDQNAFANDLVRVARWLEVPDEIT